MAPFNRQSIMATPGRVLPVTTTRTSLTVLAMLLAVGFAALTGCGDNKPNPAHTPEPGGGGHAEITLDRIPDRLV